ncbi:hypothetical protein ESO86_16140, partial [Agromyces binzhouensis]
MTRPIEGVGTAVAAFLGSAGDGPIGDPVDIDVDGWGTDEDAIWGDLHASPLRRALRSFFDNGGASAVAVRVADTGIDGVRGGLESLERVDLVNLLVLPAECAARADAHGIVAEAVAFCERRRAMLLVDPPASTGSSRRRSPSANAAGRCCSSTRPRRRDRRGGGRLLRTPPGDAARRPAR